MEIKSIIDDIQKSIILLQQRLDELKVLDSENPRDVLITRQEAADLLMVSLRQFDRYCHTYGIHKQSTINGVRVSKRQVLIYMGVIDGDNAPKRSELEVILRQDKRL